MTRKSERLESGNQLGSCYRMEACSAVGQPEPGYKMIWWSRIKMFQGGKKNRTTLKIGVKGRIRKDSKNLSLMYSEKAGTTWYYRNNVIRMESRLEHLVWSKSRLRCRQKSKYKCQETVEEVGQELRWGQSQKCQSPHRSASWNHECWLVTM